jgi:hypothetical protein
MNDWWSRHENTVGKMAFVVLLILIILTALFG